MKKAIISSTGASVYANGTLKLPLCIETGTYFALFWIIFAQDKLQSQQFLIQLGLSKKQTSIVLISQQKHFPLAAIGREELTLENQLAQLLA
jgi:hypothetical protein